MGYRSLIGVVVVALAFGQSPAIQAEIWNDPEPPMTWQEMLSCELVVLARYDSHRDRAVTLKVIESINGDAAAGQSLTVSLEHLYTLETGKVGWQLWPNRNDTSNDLPKLCYKQQIMNPGGPIPMPLLADARKPAIYFFPKHAQPSLKQLQQVQSPILETGWRQALSGEPMGLWFRLRQQIDRNVARDALEELGRTRDAAVIDLLFDEVLDRSAPDSFDHFRAAPLLARLGDRKGDVYGRASMLFHGAAPGLNAHRFYPLVRVMAMADPQRCRTDLMHCIKAHDDIPIRRAAFAGLGEIANRQIAEMMVNRLRDEQLAEAALSGLRTALRWDIDTSFPNKRDFKDDAWVLEQLRIALDDDGVPEQVRKNIRQGFGHAFRAKQPLDFSLLHQQLLEPSNRIYHGWADGETAELLRRARQECDPQMVPILVDVIDKVSIASGNRAYSLQETLQFYAWICPRAMQKEIEKRDLPDRLAAIPLHERSYLVRQAMEALTIWPSQTHGYLVKEIAQCFELADAVRNGRTNEEVLISAVEDVISEQESTFEVWNALPALLDSKSDAARQRFLEYVAAAKIGKVNPFSHERMIGPELPILLHRIYPKHSAVYCEQVGKLLASERLMERKAGIDSLLLTLQCDFGFDHEALEAERSAALAKIKPVFEQMTGKSELEARRILLADLGVQLPGEPGDAWFPILKRAAASSDANVGRNAVRIIELLVGQQGLRRIEHLPHAHRGRAVAVYLRDAGKVLE